MNGRSEKSIMNGALVALSELPDTLVWRNNTGVAWAGTQKRVRTGERIFVERGMIVLVDARPLRAGLLGSPDIIGCSGGRFIGIETKAHYGSAADAQVKFKAALERAGGLYGLARSEDEAVALVRGAR